jgi:hypothetical protein
MNILNFNEYTKNIPFWNPFSQKIEPSFFIDKNYYYILGPRIYNSDVVYETRELKYLWKFQIVYREDEILFNSLQNSKNADPCINIQINLKDRIGKIKYINQCNQYSGKYIMIWVLQIMKRLDCKSCILEDQAEKICSQRNFDGYVPISLIHKLWKDKTYYEYFDFSPYNKNNNEYKNNKMKELDSYIDLLRDMNWDLFDINHRKWNEFKNKYEFIYPSPFYAFFEFDFSNCALFYDVFNLLDNPSQPSYQTLSNITPFIIYNAQIIIFLYIYILCKSNYNLMVFQYNNFVFYYM